MSNYTQAALLLPITVCVLIAMATKLPEKIGFMAGRLVRVVINYRNGHKLDARPVQVVSQSSDNGQSPFPTRKIDWSLYQDPACRRLGKEDETLLFNT